MNKKTAIGAGLFLSVLICLFDYRAGPNISVLILYFAPALLVLWYAGAVAGMALSLASAVAWIVLDRFVRHPHAPLVVADWNWVRAAIFILVAYLLSLWKSLLEQQRHLAFEDPLTGLANRRAFSDFARLEILRASRYRQPMTVAFLDIDNFKQFNDLRGHGEGDKLLAEMGRRLQTNIRSIDLAARMGGDEFVILFPQIGPTAARAAIKNIHSKLMDGMRERQWPVSFSIGAVSFLESPPTVDEMLRRADERMYGVKKTGKAGWTLDVFVA